jgi:hypothetical protein
MGVVKDLTGQAFGRLTARRLEWRSGGGRRKAYWVCDCSGTPECGEAVVSASQLIAGRTQSCGCLRKQMTAKKKLRDMTGYTDGFLTVIGPAEQTSYGVRRWRARCSGSCGGTIKSYTVKYLTHKGILNKSCGCAATDNTRRRNEASRGKPSAKLVDLSGETFNKLLVLSRASPTGVAPVKWWCECSCEAKTCVVVAGTHLKSGATKSCGACKARSSVAPRQYDWTIAVIERGYGDLFFGTLDDPDARQSPPLTQRRTLQPKATYRKRKFGVSNS